MSFAGKDLAALASPYLRRYHKLCILARFWRKRAARLLHQTEGAVSASVVGAGIGLATGSQYRLNYPFKCRYLTSRVGVSNSARIFLWRRLRAAVSPRNGRKCESGS